MADTEKTQFEVKLPTSDDIQAIAVAIHSLAGKTSGSSKITSWKEIQTIVRSGLAKQFFSVGDQLVAERETQINHSEKHGTNSTFTITLNETAFLEKIGSAGNKDYEFIYDGSAWLYKTEAVNLADYGITISGTAVADDVINIMETADNIVFDILGFDQETPVDSDHTHSMTLGMHYGYTSLTFDIGEALIYCVTDLPAGDYKFTYKANTYYFNMPNVAKAGSQLKTPDWVETPSTIYVYDSATSTSASQTISLSTTAIDGAYDLGTFKGNDSSLVEDATVNGATIKRNDLYRVAYGSNNWENSSIRQWLQSDGAKGNWWKAKSVFDRIPSYATGNNGFLYGLDPELVSVIGKVKKNTALNNIKDGGDTTTLEESVFLLSMGEIGMSGYSSQGEQYEYFKRKCGGTMADNWATSYPGLVKTYASGSSMWWWLRSPSSWSTNNTRRVNGSGFVDYYNALSSIGVVAALSII